jgi:chlorobactene glucosyltransferase
VASFAASWIELPLLGRDPGPQPFVSILVPARDEERSIEACIRSLLAQEWLDFEVIAIDDRSSDGTPEILARLAAEDPRLRVVRGEPLPEGWIGKPWALYQGMRHARGEWLLFTDADSQHASRGVASALYFARASSSDALSIATQQQLGSFWERAILPSVLGLVLLACGTLGEVNDPARPRNALANGQYLLVERGAYEALGGHAALHAEIAEDLAFARNLKADGRFRLLLAAGESLASVRMYRSFGEIWRGFSKNAFAGTRGNLPALLAGTGLLLSLSAVPPVLAMRALRKRRWAEAAEALACTAATMTAAGWAFERTHLPRRLGLFQPLGSAVFAAIALDSARLTLFGKGVSWRGRTYASDGRKREASNPDPK